jgi:hypothetical protein
MLASGSKLGAYEIVAQIGAGGMGEVYRTRDTRLNRDVAIKSRFCPRIWPTGPLSAISPYCSTILLTG